MPLVGLLEPPVTDRQNVARLRADASLNPRHIVSATSGTPPLPGENDVQNGLKNTRRGRLTRPRQCHAEISRLAPLCTYDRLDRSRHQSEAVYGRTNSSGGVPVRVCCEKSHSTTEGIVATL